MGERESLFIRSPNPMGGPMSEEMQAKDVVLRAWKDEEFRASLPAEDRAAIPARPARMGELSDQELEAAAGALTPVAIPAAVATGAKIFGGAALTGAGAAAGAEAVNEIGERTWDSGE